MASASAHTNVTRHSEFAVMFVSSSHEICSHRGNLSSKNCPTLLQVYYLWHLDLITYLMLPFMVHLVPHGHPQLPLIVTPWLDLLGAFCTLNIQGHEWGAAEQFFMSKKTLRRIKARSPSQEGTAPGRSCFPPLSACHGSAQAARFLEVKWVP